VSPVEIHVEFNDLYMRHVATLGSGDPEDHGPWAWGHTERRRSTSCWRSRACRRTRPTFFAKLSPNALQDALKGTNGNQ